ncbi:NAD(P)H-dependent oxidoreductase, partial [Pseudomonas aeruginosa]
MQFLHLGVIGWRIVHQRQAGRIEQSGLAAEEAARILRALGGETRLFNPSGLPLVDDAPAHHPKVKELHELVQWAEGMVWSSPERHGAMTGLMKTQIDWIPLS